MGSEPNPLCGTDWGRLLKDEFAHEYWEELTAFVQEERSSFPDSVYSPDNEVFRALELTWCEHTKVVIVGQDPYHGPGQAHGLCFSVPCGVRRPRSLVRIHTELRTDVRVPTPSHGSLAPWAHRGILLLNPTLTVGAGTPLSHRGMGWERFTDKVIEVVARERDPVFLKTVIKVKHGGQWDVCQDVNWHDNGTQATALVSGLTMGFDADCGNDDYKTVGHGQVWINSDWKGGPTDSPVCFRTRVAGSRGSRCD